MYITNTLVMMRKMMSILFLVLVLLISLGLSQLTNVSEGMEAVEPGVEPTSEEEPKMEKSKCDAEVKYIPPEPKADMVAEKDVIESDVAPMQGGLTENMSNYR